MVEISLSGSGEGPGWVTAPGYSTAYVIFGWPGLAATFCPVLVLALAWPRYSARGALASMLTGALCVPLFKFAVPRIPVWRPVISQAEELAPAFLLALVAGVAVTLAARNARGS